MWSDQGGENPPVYQCGESCSHKTVVSWDPILLAGAWCTLLPMSGTNNKIVYFKTMVSCPSKDECFNICCWCPLSYTMPSLSRLVKYYSVLILVWSDEQNPPVYQCGESCSHKTEVSQEPILLAGASSILQSMYGTKVPHNMYFKTMMSTPLKDEKFQHLLLMPWQTWLTTTMSIQSLLWNIHWLDPEALALHCLRCLS